jgi:hypothetical protein
MKNTLSILLLSCLIGFSSCNLSQEITGSWLNKEAKNKNQTYQKVFIAVLSGNMDAKTTVENDLSKAATSYGINNLKSTDIFPPNMKHVDTTLVIQKIKEKGCHLIRLLKE